LKLRALRHARKRVDSVDLTLYSIHSEKVGILLKKHMWGPSPECYTLESP